MKATVSFPAELRVNFARVWRYQKSHRDDGPAGFEKLPAAAYNAPPRRE